MKSESFLLATLVCCAFALYLLVIEIIVRKTRFSPDISRRLTHISSGLFSLYLWNTFSSSIFLVCGVAFLLFISVSYYKRLLWSVHGVKRVTYGEICFPLGILLAFLISWAKPEVFVPSIMVLTFADAAAGIVADLRQKQRPSKLGSIVFFVITVLILAACMQSVPMAIVIAYVVTIVEKLSPYGVDNVTIPVATSALLLL